MTATAKTNTKNTTSELAEVLPITRPSKRQTMALDAKRAAERDAANPTTAEATFRSAAQKAADTKTRKRLAAAEAATADQLARAAEAKAAPVPTLDEAMGVKPNGKATKATTKSATPKTKAEPKTPTVKADRITLGEGVLRERTNRETGTTIQLIDSRESADYDEVKGERWVTVCVDHLASAHHADRKSARNWMSTPSEWCPKCAAAVKAASK